mmetsp:Transcript_80780/g.207978  ORF Transcript_80780/g.207978 Transcript_80780/m.207978 type:complete len:285 (+) Transcript_80780:201-1055(+)
MLRQLPVMSIEACGRADGAAHMRLAPHKGLVERVLGADDRAKFSGEPAQLTEQLHHRRDLLKLHRLDEGGAVEVAQSAMGRLDLGQGVAADDEVHLLGVGDPAPAQVGKQVAEAGPLPHEGVARVQVLVLGPRRRDVQAPQGRHQPGQEVACALLHPVLLPVGHDQRLSDSHCSLEQGLDLPLQLRLQLLELHILRSECGTAQQRIVPIEDGDRAGWLELAQQLWVRLARERGVEVRRINVEHLGAPIFVVAVGAGALDAVRRLGVVVLVAPHLGCRVTHCEFA